MMYDTNDTKVTMKMEKHPIAKDQPVLGCKDSKNTFSSDDGPEPDALMPCFSVSAKC